MTRRVCAYVNKGEFRYGESESKKRYPGTNSRVYTHVFKSAVGPGQLN